MKPVLLRQLFGNFGSANADSVKSRREEACGKKNVFVPFKKKISFHSDLCG